MAKWHNVGTEIPYNFYRGSAVVYNGKIHVLGGYDSTAHYAWNGTEWELVDYITTSLLKYDQLAVVYDNKIHLFKGVYHHTWDNNGWNGYSNMATSLPDYSSIVLYNNEVYVLGGTSLYKFNGVNNFTVVDTLPFNAYKSGVAVYNGKIHFMGSNYSSSMYKLHYTWDETNGWVQDVDLPYNFEGGSAVVYNNKIYLIGDAYTDPLSNNYCTFDGEDWETFEDGIPYYFYSGSAVVYEGGLYILGGEPQSKYFFYYDEEKRKNKVIYGNDVVLDLTADTITDVDLVQGKIAHDATGCLIKGALNLSEIVPISAISQAPPLLEIGKAYKIISQKGYAIRDYEDVTPTEAGVSISTSYTPYKRLKTSSLSYVYSKRPCGRNLFSTSGTASRTTSWTPVEFGSTVYEAYGSSYGVMLDPWFGHIDANGDIVVDRAIPTAYIHGCAFRGVTSSGTAVYSGIRLLKNGTVIQSLYGSSSTPSPSCRRIQTSFAVGDVIQIQTRCSTTTQGYARCEMGITWEGT